MNLKFFGTLKDGANLSSLFKTLRSSNCYYELDLVSKHIIVNGIKPEKKYNIIQEVYKIFEVTSIETTMTSLDIKKSNEIQFEKLKATLLNKQLSQYDLNKNIENIILEAKLIGSKRKNVTAGEILSCKIGFALPGENYSCINVVVLCHTERKKYLVVPIILNSNLSDNNHFCMKVRRNLDATYYNSNYQREESIILLNRIQEVHVSRFNVGRIGTVTKRFLNSVYQRLYLSTYKKLSLNAVIEELISPAVKFTAKGVDSQQLESFFEFVKIPNELMLLKKAFCKALMIQSSSLKDLIPILQNDSDMNLSKNAAQTKLRAEFVTWLDSIYPDIFKEYYRISLADILKIFLKCYNEIN